MSRHHAFVAPIDQIEWRESRTGKSLTLTGHAAVFDRWSEELHTFAGQFREKIAPGAFRKVLTTNPDVRLLFNHDENFPLARTKSGTLKLVEDDHGLAVEAQMGATSYANDLKIAMERGDIDQMSFAFTVADDEWDDTETDSVTRTIRQVDKLYDVSVVTYPAYPDTDAAVRELRTASEQGKIAAKPPETGPKTSIYIDGKQVGRAIASRASTTADGMTVTFDPDDIVVLQAVDDLLDEMLGEPEPEDMNQAGAMTAAEVRQIEDLPAAPPAEDSDEPDPDEPADADSPQEPVEEPHDAADPAPEEASEAHPLAELRERSQTAMQRETEAYLRLLREITK